jgi:hypothetical protein
VVRAFTIVTLLSKTGLTRRNMGVSPCKSGMDGLRLRRGEKGGLRGSTHVALFPRLLFLFFLSLITLPQRARAICTGAISDCREFYPDSPSPLTERFADPNLLSVRHFQCSAVASLGGPFAISDFKYSYDGITYFAFSGPTTLEARRGNANRAYSDIQVIDPIPFEEFFVSYTLPVGVPVGTAIEVRFLSNQDGYEENGILLDDFNNAVTVNRRATAVNPTPAPTPAPTQEVSMKNKTAIHSFPSVLPLSPSLPSLSVSGEGRNVPSDYRTHASPLPQPPQFVAYSCPSNPGKWLCLVMNKKNAFPLTFPLSSSPIISSFIDDPSSQPHATRSGK